MTVDTLTQLSKIPVGKVAEVIGYEQAFRGYQGKLMSIGLKPGTQLTVLRVAPLGDSVEINVQGSLLRLPKYEADALVVEEVENN